MPMMKLLLLLSLAIAALPAAHAQFQWRDANGRMVYSDLPPPSGVPPAQVLRKPTAVARTQPPSDASGAAQQRDPSPVSPGQTAEPAGGASAAVPAAATTAATTAATASALSATDAAAAAPSAADRELARRKRQLELADEQRKASEAQARAKRVAEVCQEQRTEMRALEGGERLARFNDRGEREYLDDGQRAERLESVRRTVRQHCAA
jgi:hypothetical protein